jgi:hypothetical protein
VGIRLPLRALDFVFSRVALLDFCDLHGYTRAVDDPRRYTISREKQVQAHGKITDAVLGEFSPKGKRYNAAVEGREAGNAPTYLKPEATTGDEVNSWRRLARGAFLFVLSVSGADSLVRCLSFGPEPNNAVPSGAASLTPRPYPNR